MRIMTMLPALGLALASSPAPAQQSDWNHPSQQQQQETKDFSGSVKDGLNTIGTSEDQALSGQSGTTSSGADPNQAHDHVHDAVKQGADVFDNVSSQFR
jgi:hypothetical protein